MKRTDSPTVFIVDDDASVRESIQGLLKSANLQSASFVAAEEFLKQQTTRRTKLPGFGRGSSWNQRFAISAPTH